MQILSKQEAALLQAIQYWDDKLSWTDEDEEEAQKHPERKRRTLAPDDLTKLGLVNAENHQKQKEAFKEFCSFCSRTRLTKLHQDGIIIAGTEVEICGAGTARDLHWIREAADIGLLLRVRDLSNVACDNFEDLARELRIKTGVFRTQGDIVEEWGAPHRKTQITFASQFIMTLLPRKAKKVLELMGTTLLHSRRRGIPSMIWLVHPLPEDNDKPVVWEGRQIIPSNEPSSKKPWRTWGKNTILYSKAEIVQAIEKGYGGRVYCRVIAKHPYYHQSYSFLEIIPNTRSSQRPVSI